MLEWTLDWLTKSFQTEGNLPWQIIVPRMGMTFVLGFVVAGIHYFTQGKSRSNPLPFLATLVLLTILIGMVNMVIGDSVARAFSLVGALAIVRFRTVVEDTRDTAYVIFAVVVGMAAGAGYLLVALVGIPIVGAAAVLVNRWGQAIERTTRRAKLRVRSEGHQLPKMELERLFSEHLKQWRLAAAETCKQGSAMDWNYQITFAANRDGTGLIQVLHKIPGILEVELRF